MKTLRFLLVMTFMFTLFISPAQAQGEDAERGYIALVTEADPSVSLDVQSHQAFDKLRLALLVAQKKGTIVDFTPNFHLGIVRIQFAPGAAVSQIGGATVYADVYDALAAVPRPSAAGSEAYNPHFDIFTSGNCVSASGLLSGDRLKGSLYDQTDQLLQTTDSYADLGGFANICFFNDIHARYRLVFKVYRPAAVLRNTYSARVPSIDFTAFNKGEAVARGNGPAGKPYVITWSHPNMDAGDTTLTVTKSGTISSTGTWSKDFGAKRFRGDDNVEINVNYGSRFSFWADRYVPSAYCDLDENSCELYTLSLTQPPLMRVTHAGVLYTLVSTGFENHGNHGHYYGEVLNGSGYPVFLKTGDGISGTGISPYKLPKLTAGIDYSTDVISGKAPARRFFWIYITQRPSGSPFASYWYERVHSNAAGNYSFDFTSVTDLLATDSIEVYISYQDRFSGNFTNALRSFIP